MDLYIDKEQSTPIYRQITMQITKMVQDGILLPGDKLPAERALADSLGIARGTIKKAYMDLASNKVIEITQGRGSFVSSEHEIQSEGRKEQAVALIEEVLDQLTKLRFEDREIQNLMQIIMMERKSRQLNLSIATVDCNPESLEIFHRQLSYISKITIHDYLLDDIVNDPHAAESLKVYDLILTTTTHYAELTGLLPESREKIFQAAVAPNYQTIIDLASIREQSRVGIICESRIFERIIRQRLRSLGIFSGKIRTLTYQKAARIGEFLSDKDIIIIPPDGAAHLSAYANELEEYTRGGGSIINFVYQMERGSLIYIEQQISRLMEAGR
jgi:DNA-binding transcriptional regulator YhcF (GntR family)